MITNSNNPYWQTSVGVVFFGIFLAVIFVIPTGIIAATTGIEIGFK